MPTPKTKKTFIDRPLMFRARLVEVTARLNGSLRSGTHSYAANVTRKRFRTLARNMARVEMKEMRKVEKNADSIA